LRLPWEMPMTGTRESRVLRVASYRQRWIAATIDSALILPIVVIVDAVGSRFGARLSALLVLDLVIVSAYRIYFHGRYGQTIGKLIVGVRLTLEDGEPIAWEHAWLRGAVELILMIAVCAAATGTLAALWVIPNEATEWPRLLLGARAPLAWYLAWIAANYGLWNAGAFLVMQANPLRSTVPDFLADTIVVSDQVPLRRRAGLRPEERSRYVTLRPTPGR